MGKLSIVIGNILEHLNDKDLIVNSANQYMIYGSGVCGTIYKKVNKELLEDYCKTHYKEYMKVNEVRITPGFNLGIDILHIYCPKYYESKTPLLDLLDSYNNIFFSAKEKCYIHYIQRMTLATEKLNTKSIPTANCVTMMMAGDLLMGVQRYTVKERRGG